MGKANRRINEKRDQIKGNQGYDLRWDLHEWCGAIVKDYKSIGD